MQKPIANKNYSGGDRSGLIGRGKAAAAGMGLCKHIVSLPIDRAPPMTIETFLLIEKLHSQNPIHNQLRAIDPKIVSLEREPI
jgi:hypothetical protein